ncbi:MAG: alpha/beta hydrolase [Dehalococcoidia bacterium]|nr:alpha/beta hydrolase [Dehalococcoidia bacterium]
MSDLEHNYATINGIRVHYVEAGSGELVILLHGFPDCWYSWRHQIKALSTQYHVIAPDLRGYNETDNTGPFDIETLREDVIQLINHLGSKRAHIIGHDWGGAIAWSLAISNPEVVQTLGICNIPHPANFFKGLRTFTQLKRSWYIFFFQIPLLPERLLARNNYQGFARLMSRIKPNTDEDVKFYVNSWKKYGLSGGINWYRAMARNIVKGKTSLTRNLNSSMQVVARTTMIWGEKDFALGKELTFDTDQYVPDLAIFYLPDNGHFVQQEAPETVNKLLLEHLSKK